jgi:hypothetical protein
MGIRLHRPAPPTMTVARGRPASSAASSTAGSSWTGDIIRVRKEDPERVKSIRVDDLPFGPGGSRQWSTEYTRILLAWAGSQDDPFGINNHVDLHDEMIKAWEEVYPTCPLGETHIVLLEKLVSSSC